MLCWKFLCLADLLHRLNPYVEQILHAVPSDLETTIQRMMRNVRNVLGSRASFRAVIMVPITGRRPHALKHLQWSSKQYKEGAPQGRLGLLKSGRVGISSQPQGASVK